MFIWLIFKLEEIDEDLPVDFYTLKARVSSNLVCDHLLVSLIFY